ncbi:Crp/Fnr family transcriptional regulator [Dactylosporangium vinaceum]|uniref:Crp/Fnr family transcriptional regulator n=1 Tax=Dactylosporangium vinaceum TaxID=53362 RepID=A0ABV5MQU9_9ACTN|nr:Crp/Fnr family transcriptional regulator [Dactylosporangium vinaceum]UAB93871.1 Crp/Fnr family transcriptional regulator [Dactylosporangium vinaceum]
MTVTALTPASLGMHSDLGGTLSRLIRAEALCASTIKVGRREVVYGCLDGDRSLYLVEQGQVKAVTPSREGKECLLGIYAAGDVFGELCLVGSDRMETVIAMTPTVLRRISAAKVLSALADAGLRGEFVRYLAQRLFEQQQLIIGLVTADSEYRLAAILLHLARKHGKREEHLLRIEERITQEELSGMVGTTRSRVGYFLKRFRNAGLVATRDDCFLLVDEPRLDDFMECGYAPAARDIRRPQVSHYTAA